MPKKAKTTSSGEAEPQEIKIEESKVNYKSKKLILDYGPRCITFELTYKDKKAHELCIEDALRADYAGNTFNVEDSAEELIIGPEKGETKDLEALFTKILKLADK